MTDPISDYLTRLRNAIKANHRVVEIPASNLKKEITKVLFDKGYILNYKFDADVGVFTVWKDTGSKPTILPSAALETPPEKPEGALVQYFIRKCLGSTREPFRKELGYAGALIAKYGPEKARFICNYAREHCVETKFRMKTLNAVTVYEFDAAAEYEREQIALAQKKVIVKAQQEQTARQAQEQNDYEKARDRLGKLKDSNPERYRRLRDRAQKNIEATHPYPRLAGEIGVELEMMQLLETEGEAK